jgi:hypothetical protein
LRLRRRFPRWGKDKLVVLLRRKGAYKARADFQSQMNQVRSAELERKASSAERYPSLDQVADYGIIGVNPASTHGTVDAAATLRVPIFQGGSVHGDVFFVSKSFLLRKTKTTTGPTPQRMCEKLWTLPHRIPGHQDDLIRGERRRDLMKAQTRMIMLRDQTVQL